jgi:glycosyltransferase involved in cell wall biosynthesis
MKHPKISIVTPNYNLGDYLEQTILSVINQGYPNLEYIIIDGGSTDQSVEIIKKYKKFLAYWVSESDGGMYDAINKGFKQSTGEIMAWINSDDMYHATAFTTVAEIFSSFSQVEWIMGRSTYYNEKGTICTTPDYFTSWSKYRYYNLDYQWIQQESTFWRRSLWEKSGAYVMRELHFAGDLELWLRFFRHAKLYSTNTLIGGYRNRTMNQKSLEGMGVYQKEAEDLIQRELSRLKHAEKNRLRKIKLFESLVMNVPFLRTSGPALRMSNKLYQFSPVLKFNGKKQCFQLG